MRTKPSNDFSAEEVLQAVVVADSYDIRFSPISSELPRCLFPFGGATILDYVLTNLEFCGIDEVIVYCTAHPSKIRDHINCTWSSRLKIIVVVSATATSVGDALRDLDSKDLIRSDFVLLHGDLPTNVDVRKVLLAHKQRRETDKSCIMTLVCTRSRRGAGDMTLMLELESDKILQYTSASDRQPYFKIPKAVLRNPKMNVRFEHSFRNTDIAVCSVSAPMFMSENFDFQTMEDLTRGVLVNTDIHGYSIFVHELQDSETVFRARDMIAYAKLSIHVLSGIYAPFHPPMVTQSQYFVNHHTRCFVHNSTKYAATCRLVRNVLVGAGSVLGRNCVLERCIVGDDCVIEDGVVLTDCFIWNGVRVGPDCSIRESILGNDVVVKANSSIANRSVLSHGVVVGPAARLDDEILVRQRQQPEDEDEDEEKAGQETPPNYGSEAVAFKYCGRERPGLSSRKSCLSELDGGDADDDYYRRIWTEKVLVPPAPVSDDDASSEASGDNDNEEAFCRELRETIQRSLTEKISTENIVLDINSLKHAYFIHIDDLHVLLMKCVMEYPFNPEACDDRRKYKARILEILERLIGVFRNYVKDDESSLNILRSFFDTAADSENEFVIESCVHILHCLYDKEVLTEEILLRWYDEEGPAGGARAAKRDTLVSDDLDGLPMDDGDLSDIEDSGDDNDNSARVWDAVAPFIKWLREAEEEDSDDSD